MKEHGERIIATPSEAQGQGFDHTYFLKNLPVMLFVLNEDDQVVFWNKECENVLGFSSEEMMKGAYTFGKLFPDPQYREHVLTRLAANKGDIQNWEVRASTKGGEEKFIEFSFVAWDIPIPGFDMVGIGHEVTSYRDLEEDLKIKERFLRDIYRCIQDGISVLDKDLRIMSVNPTMQRWYSHNIPLIGKKCHEAYHGRGVPCDVCPSIKTLKTGKAAYEEVPKVGAKGEVTGWLDLYSFPLINEETGALEGIIEYVRDATEERMALKTLEQNEEMYRDIFESSLIGLYRTTPDGKILMANPTIIKMLGYNTFDEVVKRNLEEEWFEPQYPRKIFKERMERDGQVVGLESVWIKKDGTNLFIRESAKAHKDARGKIQYYEGVVENITEKWKAEEALKESEERYRVISEQISEGVALTVDAKNVWVNHAFAKIFGYDKEEYIGKAADMVILPEDMPVLLQRMQERIQGKNIDTHLEVRGRRKDGTIIYIDVKGTLFNLQDKTAIQIVVRDITQRKKAEEDLKDSEKKYRELVENINEVIFTLDLEGHLTYASPAIERIIGTGPSGLIGRSFRDFIHPEDLPRLEKEFMETVMGAGYPSEYRVMRPDGTVRWVYSSSKPLLRDGRSVGIQGVLTDITDHKKAEEELLKIEKLESLSLLSGGLAHDFNNILTAILGNISLAKLMLRKENLKRTSELLTTAEGASIRAKDLTQQLLTFSKGSTPMKTLMNLTPVLLEFADFATSGSNVRCDVRTPDDLWAIEADQGQMGQVIQNLVLNAQQAMPSGGSVEVSAQNANVAESDGLPLAPGKYVKVQIIDHGIGIPEEHLGKIFDPYFTTKQKGSGLGLATSYAIIKRHGGHLLVESKLGQGTCVTFYVPASEAPAPAPQKKVKPPVKGQGRILVMDDDDMIRELLTEILQDLGYGVETARDGEGAIESYKQAKESGKPFDVVIMDLTIKNGMGGKEAISILKKYDRKIKAIVSSGYSTDAIMAEHKKYGFKAVLSKPYKIDDLNKTIKEVIGRKK